MLENILYPVSFTIFALNLSWTHYLALVATNSVYNKRSMTSTTGYWCAERYRLLTDFWLFFHWQLELAKAACLYKVYRNPRIWGEGRQQPVPGDNLVGWTPGSQLLLLGKRNLFSWKILFSFWLFLFFVFSNIHTCPLHMSYIILHIVAALWAPSPSHNQLYPFSLRHWAIWPRLPNFENLKKLCNLQKLSQLRIYLQDFIKKWHFIPVIHSFLGPTEKSWAIWPTAALWVIFSVKKNGWRKSGGVWYHQFIKQLWASQTSKNIYY